jgi:hypothetical protein
VATVQDSLLKAAQHQDRTHIAPFCCAALCWPRHPQGVIAMLWQMFVPEGHFQFDTLPMEYQHPRKVWGNCSSAEQRTR